MLRNLLQEHAMFSQYFAPRGKERLMFLGEQIAQRHLSFNDRLIGIVGDAGSGKSSLTKGMFPGLELSNDDDVLNPKKIMQIKDLIFEEELHESTSYHIDMRFQTAFAQMHEIVDFVQKALENKRRVIVEHFDQLYPALKVNADVLIGIGEEIIVTRPSVFGPLPKNIYDIVHTSLKYRKMAHTAEDITIQILLNELKIDHALFYSSDVRNGFVLRFTEKIDLDFDDLSDRVHKRINECLSVSYYDDNHIKIGDSIMMCTGPRLHLRNTSEMVGFELVKRFIKDVKTNTYCLVGLLEVHDDDLDNLNELHFAAR